MPGGCFLSGKKLIESKIKKDFNITLIGLKKPGKDISINLGPETLLETDDVLVLMGHDNDLEKLNKRLS